MKKLARFPWYDGQWLRRFYRAQGIIEEKYPEKLDAFLEAMDVFRTRQDFEIIEKKQIFDTATIDKIKTVIKSIKSARLEKHEMMGFGRLVVHDESYFNELQFKLTDFVSEAVKEEVEPCYNFLSLYSTMGNCPVHMDAPLAKWTLDICIDQSYEWPIHFSKTQPWPTLQSEYTTGWEQKIINNPANEFKSFTLKPGNGIIFSGSSQFHYRDKIFKGNRNDFCNLLFFHYIPKGTSKLVHEKNWGDIFGVPELNAIFGQAQNIRTQNS